MLRKILAALAGILIAVMVFMGFEKIARHYYPLPPGTDRADHAAMVAYTESLPTEAFLIVLTGWVVGSFLCGLFIKLISRSGGKTAAYISGLFLTTAGIVDIFMLPHPLWFTIIGIVVFIPMTLIGYAIFRR